MINFQQQHQISIISQIIKYSLPQYRNIMGEIQQPLSAQPHERNKRKEYISYLLMVLSSITWVAAYIYPNQHNLHPAQTLYIRGFMLTITCFIYCMINKEDLNVRRTWKEINIRNCIFLVQAFLMAIVQFYLPLTVVHTMGSIAPALVSVVQYFLDGKKLTKKQGFGMGLTLLGILLTTNGRLLSSLFDPQYKFESLFQNYKSNSMSTYMLIIAIMFIFMFFMAYAIYITNKIQASSFQVNFLFGLKLYMIACLIYPYFAPEINHENQKVLYLGFLTSGVLFAIAQIFFVCSIIMAENIGMTIMLGSSTIVVSYFFSVIRYSEKVNGFCLAGSIFITLGLSRIVLS